ncbi:hypothetical protein [Undibacterium baiyunense]|uniref:Uncharacterized protein n=1 Tax=Undibacterium baiyunense TaxID=2828731 RepID=A0A941I2G6_9BURK|nr:hypothetical protein [Undibacterium baiyunense]MBR7747473.1 hypothetical protein [Undibacterium baiyunense]
MNQEKMMWAPKIGIQKDGGVQEIRKFDAVEDRAAAVRFAEKIFDENINAAWFGVERVLVDR